MKDSRKRWKEGDFLARVAELRGVPQPPPEIVEGRRKARAEASGGRVREVATRLLDMAPGAPEPYVVIAEAVDLLVCHMPREIRALTRNWPAPTTRVAHEIRGLCFAAGGFQTEAEDSLIESLRQGEIDVPAALLAARAAALIDRDVAETFLGELATRPIGLKEREIVYSMLDDLAAPPSSARHRGKPPEEAWLVQALNYSEDVEGPAPVAATAGATGPTAQTEGEHTASVNALTRLLESEADESAVAQGGKDLSRRYLRWNPAGRWEKMKVRENQKVRPGIHADDAVPRLQHEVQLQDCEEQNALVIYLGFQQHRKVGRMLDRRTSPAELVEMMKELDLPLFVVPVGRDKTMTVAISLPDLWPGQARCLPGDTLLTLTWATARAEARDA
ncbi:MAG: hypothetical protein AMXMBFR64_54220 [Myxococcales bacterium]